MGNVVEMVKLGVVWGEEDKLHTATLIGAGQEAAELNMLAGSAYQGLRRIFGETIKGLIVNSDGSITLRYEYGPCKRTILSALREVLPGYGFEPVAN